MDPYDASALLAAVIGVAALAVLVKARRSSRDRAARSTRSVAAALGFEYRDRPGPGDLEALDRLGLAAATGATGVHRLMSGDHRGEPVLIAETATAEAEGDALGPSKDEVGMVAAFVIGILTRGLLRHLGGRDDRVAVVADLVLVIGAPTPRVPGFRIAPHEVTSEGDWLDRLVGPRSYRGPEPDGGLRRAFEQEYRLDVDGLDPLPDAFLERAARVLVGRPGDWTVYTADGRLVVRISRWRASSQLRSARAYRAVLDDLVALIQALRPAPEATAPAAAEPTAEPAARRDVATIRGSLERLRQATKAMPEDP